MIVIAGGTGRLGTRVVRRLKARGLPVRVMTRDLSRADPLSDLGVEVVRCDIRDRASVEAALEGATTVISAVQGFAGPGRVSPQSVDRDGNANLIDCAEAVGAEVILMSVVGASPDNPMDLFRAKYAAEQRLRAGNARWTIIRSTAFVELWAEIMVKPIVFGRGANPINFVTVGDVAEVVERAVVDPQLHGTVIEVGGPEDFTFNQLAALLHESGGRPVRIRHIPLWLLRSVSPLSRRARAAVAMDTIDMAFDARAAGADLPMTDVRTVLTRPATAQR